MSSYRAMRKQEARVKKVKRVVVEVTLGCGCATTVDMPADFDKEKYLSTFRTSRCRACSPA